MNILLRRWTKPLTALLNCREKMIRCKHEYYRNLMVSVTGALWKVSLNTQNVDVLEDLGVVGWLIHILMEKSESLDDLQFNLVQAEVLTNVVGALAETAELEVNSFVR